MTNKKTQTAHRSLITILTIIGVGMESVSGSCLALFVNIIWIWEEDLEHAEFTVWKRIETFVKSVN